MSTRVLILNVAITIASAFAYQQGQIPAESWYKENAQQISKESPRITAGALQDDEIAIKAAYPTVKDFYSNKQFGQSDSELSEIVGRAWSDYRARNPTIQFTADDFVKFAQEYGGLKITSRPPGATIRVDDKPWSGSTDMQAAARTGERSIRLLKTGYQDEIGTAVVKRGEWTTFSRKLRKK